MKHEDVAQLRMDVFLASVDRVDLDRRDIAAFEFLIVSEVKISLVLPTASPFVTR